MTLCFEGLLQGDVSGKRLKHGDSEAVSVGCKALPCCCGKRGTIT